MIDNLGLVILPFVALIFLLGGALLLRGASSRLGALCVVAGAALFLAAELYGVFTLRPYLGRFFDPEWRTQVATVEIGATLGLLLCGVGLVMHALKNPR
jgi:glucan phosphoethanolaminetransferase (alkaline phosphatase superfamily)